MDNFREIGEGVGSVLNAIGSGISYLAMNVSNLFSQPGKPYRSETPAQQTQAMAENTQAIENEQMKKLEEELNNIWTKNSEAYAGYGTNSLTEEQIAEYERMRNAAMYAPTMDRPARRQFEDSYEVWQWNKRVERQYRIDGLKRERESISDEINNELNSNVYERGYGGMLSSSQRLTELTNRLNDINNQIGILYKEQLMDYRIEDNYYVSNVDGIEIRMSRRNFRAPVAANVNNWTGNTPINRAIENLSSKALLVLEENSQALNLDAVEVSSLWRNSATSSHGSGRGIDIVAVTRGNLTVRFNNVNGEPSAAARALRNEIYNAFINDPRVSQTLDPWWLKSKIPGKSYNYPNTWQDVNNMYLSPIGVSLIEYDKSSYPQQLQWVNNDGSLRNMLLYRHHLHITLF
ncbi:hypothetical protein [Thermospira aquatica]|uniref:Uncharacterized protein n=1 Tax=Thermospira aquatica TaxID=2828656 RepID=A0AAX3BAW2_9SPIR|nr:hypothetical protein [Thermospira aquatica]URA09422.1 hypothetical protein KDW03_07965 [Thermospira aquatica]